MHVHSALSMDPRRPNRNDSCESSGRTGKIVLCKSDGVSFRFDVEREEKRRGKGREKREPEKRRKRGKKLDFVQLYGTRRNGRGENDERDPCVAMATEPPGVEETLISRHEFRKRIREYGIPAGLKEPVKLGLAPPMRGEGSGDRGREKVGMEIR